MNNEEIKEILNTAKNKGYIDLDYDESRLLLDYITNLQEENERLKEELLSKPDNEITLQTAEGQIMTIIQSERIDMQQKLNKSLEEIYKRYNDYKSRVEKGIEYGDNCLELLKDQSNYVCESIDIVELLKMIHKNYIDILNGKSDE